METIEKTQKCPFCGEEILTAAKKCKHCGEWLTEQTPPKSENIPEPPTTVHNKNSDSKAVIGWFMNYFVHVIRFQYADFKGTATRKEYWIYVLFSGVFGWLLATIGAFANGTIGLIGTIVFLCITLALLVPSVAISVRRLHDTGKSGWWLFIAFIPIIGSIWLLVLLCQKGETANKKVSFATSDIIIIVASILLPLGAYTANAFSSEDNNESATTQTQSVGNNNLITQTSIAGVEIIGKTPKEVKPNFNDALTWEYIEENEEYSQPESYLIKNGEQHLMRFFIYNGRFSAMEIYDPSLATADGLHVGSTAGDILKLYPNTTVGNAEFGEYTEINGILYVFDSNWEKTVGDYSNSEYSSIVNKGIKIRAIFPVDAGE
ncbi:MAG: DUF805 domain-containing protein [Bacteroidales bacterium]|jgi:uncharacterized membrane protein YhaH (DUF805 family)|nr:DUF805 domain-containing protein [Bacteroidales bacterium]